MAVTINGSGQVPVQIVQTVKTDTFTSSTASFVDITDASVTITPTSSSNRVLVSFSCLVSGTLNSGTMVRLMRGSTAIAVGASAGSRSPASGSGSTTGATIMGQQITLQFLDSPATTSATIYKLQAFAESGTSLFVGRTNNDADVVQIGRYPTIITAMEISG